MGGTVPPATRDPRPATDISPFQELVCADKKIMTSRGRRSPSGDVEAAEAIEFGSSESAPPLDAPQPIHCASQVVEIPD